MTDREFRRLSRADLIEIIYELQQSEKALRSEVEELKKRLEERQIAISESGSLAEVLAKLNGLFEAAQATADGYTEEAERLLAVAQHTKDQADEYEADIKRHIGTLSRLTMQQRKEMLEKTEKECRKLREAAQEGRRAPPQTGRGGPMRPAKESRNNGEGDR